LTAPLLDGRLTWFGATESAAGGRCRNRRQTGRIRGSVYPRRKVYGRAL